ncbi:MAG: hypothetical protein NTX78_02550 [Rhodoluna sp.]|jgi:hypothetical protein|nr:hypothetical protein [Rhodoluna sp.]
MAGSTGRNNDIISLRIVTQFPAEAARIFSIIGDGGQWPETLNPRILKRNPNSRVIAALADFSRPEFTIEPNTEGCEVTLLHDLIQNDEDRKEYQKLWGAWFKTINKRVTV